FGGSDEIEELSEELVRLASAHIEEVEAVGGMTRAIEMGIPKARIEEAAARRQAAIDSGKEVIVGVNRFEPPEDYDLDILRVDNEEVRRQQIERLHVVRSRRDSKIVEDALQRLESTARQASGSVLAAAIEAARARATVGEISYSLEKVFGRYEAEASLVSGVYAKGVMDDDRFRTARDLSQKFERQYGRPPRIMLAKLGQDGHDRGARVVASSFADMGFDVDIGPLFQTPEEAARQAIENDVHILGVSTLAGAHRKLLPEVVQALESEGRNDIIVIAGGVIPPQDREELQNHGINMIFGPGTILSEAASDILELLLTKPASKQNE
ncbi:MAG: cobalamin-dependent protein, partial [Rhodothermia bacterium]|nr:cobalamin-dependent protein [Rhodothermia bacterium]